MPALPPGRNDPSGQQESGTRAIRVLNVDDDDAPPFAALEIVGWDSDRRAFRVRRCSITGRNDLLFGGMGAIPSRMEGQAYGDLQHVAGFVPSEGANPHAGEVWGVQAGTWLLAPNYPGYSILDTTTASRGFCVVQKQRTNITEFIRVTGTVNPDLDLPDDWVEAELVFHDPITDAWGTTSPTTPVYFRDIYNRKGYYATQNGTSGPCYVHVTRTGLREGRPVYVGNERCSTTTTTLAPCLGVCDWEWDIVTKRWGLDANTCDPASSCKCLAPTFCPPDDGETYCTQTRCGRLAAHQSGPNCTGTTTTAAPTCTTTNSPACDKTCEFFSHPILGWVQTANNCPGSCPCPYPPGGSGGCETVTTACQVIPVVCGGGCLYTWVTPPDEEPYWYRHASSCFQSGFPPNCFCDAPTEDGSLCGEVIETPCYIHGGAGGAGGSGGCQCCDNTTTTAAPGTCGRCLWGNDDGTTWENRRDCPGCLCLEPDTAPSGVCDLRETPCFTTTTTTTSGPTTTAAPTTTLTPTTTLAPTTTTTAAPCVCCGGFGADPVQASVTGPIGAGCGPVTGYLISLTRFTGDIWQGTYTYPGGPTGLLQVRCGADGFTFIGFIDYSSGGLTSSYSGTLTDGGGGFLNGSAVVSGGPCSGAAVSIVVAHPCPSSTYCPPTTTTTTTTTGAPGTTTTGSPVVCPDGVYTCDQTPSPYGCLLRCVGGRGVLVVDNCVSSYRCLSCIGFDGAACPGGVADGEFYAEALTGCPATSACVTTTSGPTTTLAPTTTTTTAPTTTTTAAPTTTTTTTAAPTTTGLPVGVCCCMDDPGSCVAAGVTQAWCDENCTMGCGGACSWYAGAGCEVCGTP